VKSSTIRKLTKSLMVVLPSSVITHAAFAETVRGEIATFGSPDVRKTIIRPESGGTAVVLCPGHRVFELIQLAGTITSVNGNMKTLKNSNEPCLTAESFEIHDIAKGRPAIVGTLKMIEKGVYAIVNSEGKTWRLSKLPPSLKEYLNLTLVLDLVANSAATRETNWLVARAFMMPVP